MKNIYQLISHLPSLLKKEKQKSLFVLLLSLMFSIYSLGQNVDFSQAANNVKNGAGLGRVQWINGDLNSQNSSYAEGLSVPQRIILSDLTGTTHTLTFKFKVSESPGFGYDFITSWQQAVTDAAGKLVGLDLFDAGTLGADRFIDINPNTISEADYIALHEAVPTTHQSVSIPAYTHDGSNDALADALNARVAAYGQPLTLDIYCGQDINSASISFDGFEGVGGGGRLAIMTLTWTTAVESALASIEFAGHLAISDPPASGNGAASMHGSSYHIKLGSLDDENFTSGRDNQIRVVQPSIDCVPPDVDDQELHACDDGTGHASFTLDLTVQGNPTIEWFSDIDLTQSINSPYTSSGGTVFAKVTDATGCYAVAEVTLVVDPLPTVSCPGDMDVCIDASSFALTGATPTGGTYAVDGVTATNFDPATAGKGAHTITYTYSDGNTCSNSCSFTITVHDLPTVSCPGNSSVCINDASFALSGATPTGGNYTVDGVAATNFDPATAGVGDHTITYTYSDGNNCSNLCSFTITVNSNPTIGTITPYSTCTGTSNGSIVLATCDNGISYQLKTCSGTSVQSAKTCSSGSITWTGLAAGSYKITATNTTTQCATTSSCVTVIGAYCSSTLTQGFYGNLGGKDCNGKTAIEVIKAAVGLNNNVKFGNQSTGGAGCKSFTLKYTDLTTSDGGKLKIFKMLPGGTTPAVLGCTNQVSCTGFQYTATYDCLVSWPYVSIQPSGSQKGSINNVLLAQTMTLFFNINNPGSNLGSLVLTGNKLTFNALACGSSTPGAFASYQYIPCTVLTYLTTNYTGSGHPNINDMYDMANKVLGGIITTITPSDMNAALNAINVGFDKGKALVKQELVNCTLSRTVQVVTAEGLPLTDLNVQTYPNPFSNMVSFHITPTVSGDAKLEIFNLSGQKVKNIAWGYLKAGQNRSFTVDLSAAKASSVLIYKLTVGNQELRGKLIQLK